MDIVYTSRTADSVTFDREAITLMLLQDDHPTLEAFLEEIKERLTPPSGDTCEQCESIRQFIQQVRSR